MLNSYSGIKFKIWLVFLWEIFIRRVWRCLAALGIQVDPSSHLIIVGVMQTLGAIVPITTVAQMDGIGLMRLLGPVLVLDRIPDGPRHHSRLFRGIRLNRILTLAVRYQIRIG